LSQSPTGVTLGRRPGNVTPVTRSIVVGIVALVLALVPGRADADVFRNVAYSPVAMTTMLRALNYPRAHERELSCTGLGRASNGRYASFRCLARWGHHGHTVFEAAGAGSGGWLCIGSSVSLCRVLNHGYAPKRPSATPLPVAKAAAQGYLQNHFHRIAAPPAKIHPCVEARTNAWTCDYQLSGPLAPPVAISITLTPVVGGWVVAGSLPGGKRPPY
jgi:hypothetical protein